MLMERADLNRITMPLDTHNETSTHREEMREAVLVRLQAGGLSGWGEGVADPAPWYSSETVAGSYQILRECLLPAVLGQAVPDLATLRQRIAWVKGNPMAKAALELAWWDLHGQHTGQSVQQLLGGERARVPVGVSVGIQPTLDALLQTVEGYRTQGYNRIKIKVKPGWLDAPVRALRAAFGATLPLQVDANSAFALADASLFQALDDAGLLLIEQPLADDDLVEHAALQAQVQTPVCLDESITSYAAAAAALALRACRVINIKPGRVGGLSVARAIHDLCRAQGVPVWCGGMLETGIGRAGNLALASLPGFTLPGDISASARYYHTDLITTPFVLNAADSTITVPTGPGLGVQVDPAVLARVTRSQETVLPA
jgi:O-succinylbenzoate synthase